MPFEPFRFVHAANLRLDATLQCTVALPDAEQAVVEDATLTAFEQLVYACVEHAADFLLLTGNSFIERDRSLRARLTLRDGFRELQKNSIPVFVVPGEQDPPEAWQAVPELPDNVTVCYPSNPEPVAVVRDGRVIATIANTLLYGAADHFGIKTSPTTGDRRPYRIGMLHPSRLAELESVDPDADSEADVEERPVQAELPATRVDEASDHALAGFLRQALVDYAVLAAQVHRRTIRMTSGIAHWPGAIQPLSAADHGSHGATLIEVDAEGAAETTRLPTVVARWKSFDLEIPGEAGPADVAALCRTRLDDESREATESIWLVTWSLLAPATLIDELTAAGYAEQLAADVESLRADDQPRCVHRFRVFAGSGTSQPQIRNPLAEQFSRLAGELRIDEAHLQELIARGTGELGWDDRLTALVSKLDSGMVGAHVRRLGTQWFASVEAAPELPPERPDQPEPAEFDSTEEST